MKVKVFIEKELTPKEILESKIPGLTTLLVGPNRPGDSCFDFPQRKALGVDRDVLLVAQEEFAEQSEISGFRKLLIKPLFFIECGNFSKSVCGATYEKHDEMIKEYLQNNIHRAILIQEEKDNESHYPSIRR